MAFLTYRDNSLFIEDISLENLAEEFGTPCYIYSRSALVANWQAFTEALHSINYRICYAVKANSNIAILQLFANWGAGFDIVSVGELNRVLAAGGEANKIIFSGVGKTEAEIMTAIASNIFCFNVESINELERLQQIAKRSGKIVQIALRINPNINAGTHQHIATGLKDNKFGIDIEEIPAILDKLPTYSALKLIGLACHIGSQITKLEPFLKALDTLITIYQQLREKDFTIQFLNVGGGLGITYHEEHPPTIKEYAKALVEKLKSYPLELILEPGRALVANAGILLTRVEYLKHTQQKNFAIVDAGMNDLLRPALYDAWQEIIPVKLNTEEKKSYDIAGPLCESADILGKNRSLAIKSGDLLAIKDVGAYGFSMSSNYNSRPRPPEILVDQDRAYLIRRRESFDRLFRCGKLIN